jgi:deoxyribonuclease-1-like protein
MPRFVPLIVLAVGLGIVGCNVEKALDDLAGQTAAQTAGRGQTPAPKPVSSDDTIKIASFNIQVFGASKLSKPEVTDVLVKVIRRFDVVAVQEVRSKDQNVVPRFVEMINAQGAHYDYVIGPRLGRTSSKEQYAFLFDASRLEVDRRAVYTVPDPQDYLHREPLVARFRVRGLPADQAFTFSLVNIHTDPDETDLELDALDDVFVAVQRDGSGEDDVILLGDLNVDEYHLGELGDLPNIVYVTSGVTTNTRGTESYDNILFDRRPTAEFTGSWGVLDLAAEFGLTLDEALEVSDHLPVWAEFSIYEGGAAGSVAARRGTTAR